MDLGLAGKVAIVTGSGGGIGRSVACSLAREGTRVVVADINGQNLDTIVRDLEHLGAQSIAHIVDVSSKSSVEKLIARAMQYFGRIDILVNSAGILSLTDLESTTESEWDRLLDVNLKGTFFCCQLALKHMKVNGWGRIVNIASIAGKDGGVVAPHYAVSKAGVICLTKCFARYGAQFSITVNCISPGPVDTEMTCDWPTALREQRLQQTPLKRFAQPRDIAGMVVFLASTHSVHITGENIDINGGILMD